MLNPKIFIQNLLILSENFNFQYKSEYSDLIYSALKEKVSDTQMNKITQDIIKTVSQAEWNKDFGFGGRPAVADWIAAYEPKPIKKTVYEKCKITGANLVRETWVMPEEETKKLEKK